MLKQVLFLLVFRFFGAEPKILIKIFLSFDHSEFENDSSAEKSQFVSICTLNAWLNLHKRGLISVPFFFGSLF